MEFKFYKSYLDLIEKEYSIRTFDRLTDFEKKLRQSKFRKFVLDTYGYTYSSILLLERTILTGMIRPQRLLLDGDDYYLACDMTTNTYYLNYKHLLMIDIDFYKSTDANIPSVSVELFNRDVEDNPDNTWILYRSKGGVHAFLISKEMDNRSKESCELMIKLKCDFNYVVYSYLRGWCVRLNRKKNEDKVICEKICKIGQNKEIPGLEKLVNLHVRLIDVFKDEDPSMMYGV